MDKRTHLQKPVVLPVETLSGCLHLNTHHDRSSGMMAFPVRPLACPTGRDLATFFHLCRRATNWALALALALHILHSSIFLIPFWLALSGLFGSSILPALTGHSHLKPLNQCQGVFSNAISCRRKSRSRRRRTRRRSSCTLKPTSVFFDKMNEARATYSCLLLITRQRSVLLV